MNIRSKVRFTREPLITYANVVQAPCWIIGARTDTFNQFIITHATNLSAIHRGSLLQ